MSGGKGKRASISSLARHGLSGVCSKYSSSHLRKPLLFFPFLLHACLSFTRPLFPPVFTDAIFNSWKDERCVHQRGGEWSQPPPRPHGVTVGECVNGRTAYVRQLFRFKHPHVYQG